MDCSSRTSCASKPFLGPSSSLPKAPVVGSKDLNVFRSSNWIVSATHKVTAMEYFPLQTAHARDDFRWLGAWRFFAGRGIPGSDGLLTPVRRNYYVWCVIVSKTRASPWLHQKNRRSTTTNLFQAWLLIAMCIVGRWRVKCCVMMSSLLRCLLVKKPAFLHIFIWMMQIEESRDKSVEGVLIEKLAKL